MEELINIIANVGFPISVAVYLLIRIEGKLTQLTRAICDLREAIITLPRERLSSPSNSLSDYSRVSAYADNQI